MPEKFRTTTSFQGGRTVKGYQGARAGEAFDTGEEAKQQEQDTADWAAFASSIGQPAQIFSGLGGAAARTRYRGQFDLWRSGKSAKPGTIGGLIAGQAK